VLALARTVVDLCGGVSTIEHAPARAGEILNSLARISTLRDVLGVVAKTSLVDGLRATLA
jgi:nucleoside-diphosphate-sugar epimerase